VPRTAQTTHATPVRAPKGGGWLKVLVVVLVVVGLLAGAAFWALHKLGTLSIFQTTGCTASSPAGSMTLDLEQAKNASTIAAVGVSLGVPTFGIEVAEATARQESKLHNIDYGDRDSVGLFQQRPSQGWGTVAQIADPVYAATAFYQRLRQQPNWTRLEVTQAAQLVQRSAAPEAYAQWEPQARAIAAALTGEDDASLSCHDLKLGPPADYLVTVARRELGTANLSGPQPPDRGRALASWLVAHSDRLGIDRVTLDGNTWTAESGEWTRTGPLDGQLSLHQLAPPA